MPLRKPPESGALTGAGHGRRSGIGLGGSGGSFPSTLVVVPCAATLPHLRCLSLSLSLSLSTPTLPLSSYLGSVATTPPLPTHSSLETSLSTLKTRYPMIPLAGRFPTVVLREAPWLRATAAERRCVSASRRAALCARIREIASQEMAGRRTRMRRSEEEGSAERDGGVAVDVG
ncbi:hypothetical protein PMIN07_003954 [Paraphaeosphaeria minitans]